MPKNARFFGLFALIFAIVAGSAAPARAEFFGCKSDRGKVLSSRIISSGPSRQVGATVRQSHPQRYAHDFSAQSSRHRYSSRRNW